MSSWSLKIAPAAAAWIAMTLIATAGPIASNTDTPTGDVWIAPEAPNPTPAQTAQQSPAQRPLPTGDFWPAEDDAVRAADAPAPPHDQSAAREEVATGAVK
jgi:hypothetical protein